MLVACLGSISVLMRLAPEKKRNKNKKEKKAKQESGKLAENKMAAE